MRIRRMLHVSTVVGFSSVLMVAATIVTLLVLDARHSVETQGLDNAVRKMSVMRSLQPDFSHSQNPRAIQQWQAVHAELSPILTLMPALDEQSQILKAHVIQEQAALATLFERLSLANQDAVGTDIRELIGGQLSVRSASMVSDILTIRDLTDQQIVREKKWVTAGAAGSVAVLAGVILVLLRIMYRRIAGPIAKLQEATANLGAGHLDQPVFMSGSDEVSALAESFDRMRLALRDRLLDLSDTKARLEDANVHLEQRVLERTRQLEVALTQIRELDQAKSRFFANLSHELRTPLALILGPVAELLAVSGLPLEWRHDLEVVRRNAQTLHTYVNDLLDLSRLDAGRMRLDYSETDLARVVRSVADHFMSATAHRNIDLRLTMPDAVVAQVDQAKVSRVLFNLMSNAFKHVPDGSGRVEVALLADNGHAIMEVVDNGPGIPVEMREKIFERFVQGDDPQRSAGTGLGLAIAEEFVVQHGGGIMVDDAAGGAGALFRVVLPLTAPEGTYVAGTGDVLDSVYLVPVQESQAGQTETGLVDATSDDALPLVLIVEDNPDLRAFIAKALKGIARIAMSEDGMDGLAAAGRLHPDLVLTDIMMPRMSGDRMVAEMRERADLADTPVMVLSARADEPLRIRLLRGQAQDYLVKPFAADELQARAANLLQLKRARDLLRAEISGSHENLETLAREVTALNHRLRDAADEMRVARDKAENASRAKSAFLNMVSHELRTPLTQLELQLAVLRRRFRSLLDEEQKDIMSDSTAALHRLAGLVGSVLDYSRIESDRLMVKPESFDLAGLVADVCTDLRQTAAERGLNFTIETEGDPGPLVSDPALVRLAIRNLVDNAIKYTAQGGVSVRLAAVDGVRKVEVADTGPGIPPEFQEKMFDPFEQGEDVDRKHTPGVGLGLALVRELAPALGGRISVVSVPGQGSTFTIDLASLEG